MNVLWGVDDEYLMMPVETCSSQDGQLIREQLVALMETEQTYRVRAVSCTAGEVGGRIPIDEWRRKICQWAFRVIDHFRLDREVVAIGMNMFDRFLISHKGNGDGDLWQSRCYCPSCKRNVDSRTYQLAAMTSVFLAAKLHTVVTDVNPLKPHRKQFKLSTFVELSRGQFYEDDIIRMEQTMLATLQWRVSPPIPMIFVSYLLTLMPSPELVPSVSKAYYDLVVHVLRELSRYLTELSTCLGGSCCHQLPSHVGLAAILVSMDLLTLQALPISVRDAFRQKVSQVCNISSHQRYGPIPQLRSILMGAIWPEMLLDEAEQVTSDPSHPISIAHQYGLLDLTRIHRAQRRKPLHPDTAVGFTPPGSPKLGSRNQSFIEGSPVSVIR